MKFILKIFATTAFWCFGMNIGLSKSQANAEQFWNIKIEQFTCLKDNIETYMAIDKPKIIIFLKECPETDIAKIISSHTVNLALPGSKKIKQTEASPTEVISIDKRFLPCVSEIETPEDAIIVRLPKNPCK